MSLVLAIFFAGLSLGSWFAGKYARHPSLSLKWYAYLEAGIGVYGLVVIYPLVHFHSILAHFPFSGSMGWLGHVAKFVLCGALLTPPTLAMGATLPLLVGLLQRNKSQMVSLLYAINTFGAAAGTFVGAFWLIPKFGITTSNHITGIANIIIAGVCLALSRYSLVAPPLRLINQGVGRIAKADRLELSLLWIAAVCGFTSLTSEVVWNKYLGIFLGNNIFGLGLVLTLYLLGIAIGAVIINRVLDQVKNPTGLMIGLLSVAALGTALTAYFFNWVPVASILLAYGTGLHSSMLWIKCIVVGVLLLPVTITFGALFPLIVHIFKKDQNDDARAVSWIYSINTVGAILGSYLAGIWLIPHIGSTWTLRIAAFCLAATIVLPLLQFGSQRRWAPALAGVFALLLLFAPPVDFTNILKSAYIQKFETANFPTLMKYFEKEYEQYKWVGEGETSIISLSHDPKDGPSYKEYLRLKTNGLNESVYHQNNLNELPRYEAMLALVPYLFADQPKNAFVVGYGGGYTVDLMTSLPIAKVHVVELEKAILQAADVVHKGNNPLLKRKNLDLSIEDARFVLATKMHAPLDIIVSQPSHSWLAGAANLFTEDFFQIVSSNLSDKGVFGQWLNLYNMDVATLKSILGTFFRVFPHGAVFSGEGDQEMILVGSKAPLNFNLPIAQSIARQPVLLKKLQEVPYKSPADLIAHFALSREQVLALTDKAPLNSDDNAFAETRQSRLFYSGVPHEDLPQGFLTSNYDGDFGRILPSNEDWSYPVLAAQVAGNQHQKFFRLLGKYEERRKNQPTDYAKLGYLCLKAQRYESALAYLRQAFPKEKNTANLNLLLSALTETGRTKEAITTAQANSRLLDKVGECYQLNAMVIAKADGTDKLAGKLVSDVEGYTHACGDFYNKVVGDYYFSNQNYEVALPFYEAYYRVFNQNVEVLKKMAASYIAQNDWSNAKSFSNYLPGVAEGEKKQLESLVKFYEKQNLHADAQALQAKVEQMSETANF